MCINAKEDHRRKEKLLVLRTIAVGQALALEALLQHIDAENGAVNNPHIIEALDCISLINARLHDFKYSLTTGATPCPKP